jgi:hypothetical protein
MLKSCALLRSVRGAISNGCPYRDNNLKVRVADHSGTTSFLIPGQMGVSRYSSGESSYDRSGDKLGCFQPLRNHGQ